MGTSLSFEVPNIMLPSPPDRMLTFLPAVPCLLAPGLVLGTFSVHLVPHRSLANLKAFTDPTVPWDDEEKRTKFMLNYIRSNPCILWDTPEKLRAYTAFISHDPEAKK